MHIKCIIISGRRWQQHFRHYLFWAAALCEQKPVWSILFVFILLLTPERNALVAAVQELYQKSSRSRKRLEISCQFPPSASTFFVSLRVRGQYRGICFQVPHNNIRISAGENYINGHDKKKYEIL